MDVVSYCCISTPEIVTASLGDSEWRIRDLFRYAAKNPPFMVFINNIDAVSPKSGKKGGRWGERYGEEDGGAVLNVPLWTNAGEQSGGRVGPHSGGNQSTGGWGRGTVAEKASSVVRGDTGAVYSGRSKGSGKKVS